jgi:flagellar basal-body rod protein FlgF
MDEILGVALKAMHADMARVEQVAMNMANVSTPGYKRGMVVQGAQNASFASALQAAGRAQDSTPATSVGFASDPRPGTLKATGQNLDVALIGEGYFEVATETGPAYTRQGQFRVDARGRLVNAQGHPVMGTGGEIYLNTTNPVISESGVITEPGFREGVAPAGQLKVVRFPAETRPESLGNGLFAAATGMTQASATEVQVRQGYQENSNVNAAHEMTQLMLAMRHFETMNRVIQSRDDMLGTAIRKLGDGQ